MRTAFLKELSWDSELFKRPITSLVVPQGSTVLNLPALHDCHFVQTKVDAQDMVALEQLTRYGFRFVEGEIDLSLHIPSVVAPPSAATAQIADSTDLPALREMAATSMAFSRFRNPWYTQEEKENHYKQWVANAVNATYDDVCLLNRDDAGSPCAFISLRKLHDGNVRIGLFTVREDCRQRGLGRRLMMAAIKWALAKGARTLHVATQTSNIVALQLYQSCGAQITSTSYWLYWTNNRATETERD